MINNFKSNWWTKEEDNILIEKYGTVLIKNLVPLLNRSEGAISSRAHILGVKSNTLLRLKYEVNHNFFNELNNDSCYFAGLLAADGCIKGGNRISLALTDLELVESFKYNIGYTGPIYHRQRTSNKQIYDIAITSNQLIKTLSTNFNIVPKKSLILQPPNLIDLEHKLAFIVGYIDGDGSIAITRNNQLYFMCCGTFDMMSWIGSILDRKIRSNGISKTNFKIEAKCMPALKILEMLYKIKTPIKLSRKWNKIKELINAS